MFSSTTYVIRGARVSDARDLERIAALDSQRPLRGHILIGEIDGRPQAAMSLDDNRLIANPFVHTESLAAHLRIRARGIHAAGLRSLRAPARLRSRRSGPSRPGRTGAPCARTPRSCRAAR